MDGWRYPNRSTTEALNRHRLAALCEIIHAEMCAEICAVMYAEMYAEIFTETFAEISTVRTAESARRCALLEHEIRVLLALAIRRPRDTMRRLRVASSCGHQAVIRWSSGGHQVVIRWSSGSLRGVLEGS